MVVAWCLVSLLDLTSSLTSGRQSWRRAAEALLRRYWTSAGCITPLSDNPCKKRSSGTASGAEGGVGRWEGAGIERLPRAGEKPAAASSISPFWPASHG